ncbi:hypothetical protein CDAR_558211 [Caerostris darwini]|uniref:Uncharacterized protein n=1 Tax=Caerostris darwini TaxID=1538125 RepID=A0AAV4R826_9ARAC|nr:hypothetical protein CDAR_558211 [Caerostris darwini]
MLYPNLHYTSLRDASRIHQSAWRRPAETQSINRKSARRRWKNKQASRSKQVPSGMQGHLRSPTALGVSLRVKCAYAVGGWESSHRLLHPRRLTIPLLNEAPFGGAPIIPSFFNAPA